MKRFLTVLVSLSFLTFSAAALTGCCCGDSEVNLDELQKELEKAEKEAKDEADDSDDKAEDKADDSDDKADKADDKADEKADDKGSASGGALGKVTIEDVNKIMTGDGWKSQAKSEAGFVKTETFSKKVKFISVTIGDYPNQLSADATVKAYDKNANAVAKQDGKRVVIVLASGKADKKLAQEILDKITK